MRLKFTKKAEQGILKYSQSHNPSETSHKGHDIKVDSAKNIFTWKKRLSTDEIKRIKEGTKEISEKFYSEDEW